MSESTSPSTLINPDPTVPVELGLGADLDTEANSEKAGSIDRRPQNRVIEAYISDAERYVSIATNDAEIHSALAVHGLDANEIATAKRLISALRETFHARAKGMGTKSEATEQLNEIIDKNREDYRAFRDISRACYPSQADRLALSVSGDMTDDTSRFITVATASYHAAQVVPYAAKLAKRGFPTTRLKQLLHALEELTAVSADKVGADGSAMRDTAARDQAYQELRAFMKEWKGIAKAALRNTPGAFKKLGL